MGVSFLLKKEKMFAYDGNGCHTVRVQQSRVQSVANRKEPNLKMFAFFALQPLEPYKQQSSERETSGREQK